LILPINSTNFLVRSGGKKKSALKNVKLGKM
jgi:hypothetical protein